MNIVRKSRSRSTAHLSTPRILRDVILLTFALTLTACGTTNTPTYPTTGTVKFSDGTPLSSGFISFRSVDDPKHPCAKGTIQSDGTFKLTTFVPDDGAVIGTHQVLLTVPTPGDRPGFQTEKSRPIAPSFSSYETSGLEFSVGKDPKENHFDIEVK